MSHAASRLIIAGLALSLSLFAAQAEWLGVERVVSVGDIHGDYGGFVEVLRMAGLIDDQNRWTGGKTHLVQVGDVCDRGADTRKVMDLLMDLEKQAALAGGHVHALVGNHEAMNLLGDLRYTTPGEFAAFADARSERLRDDYWKKEPGSRTTGDTARKVWDLEHPLGWFEHKTAFSDIGKYGKWIRAHNAIVKINDTIYLHGGISPKYASIPIKRINEMIAGELNDFTTMKKEGGPVTSDDGPLWYRGMAQEWYNGAGPDSGPGIPALVDKVLATNGAKRIVIGHTQTGGAIIPRFGGKVVMIDVGVTAVFGSGRAVLLIEGDNVLAIHRGQRVALPTDTNGPGLLEYAKKILSLEPRKSQVADYVAFTEGALAEGH